MQRVVEFCIVACWLGCAADPTQVRLQLEADPIVRARAVRLRLEVRGPDGDLADRDVAIPADGEFPFEVPLVPRGGDASRRFEVEVVLFDADDNELLTRRAEGGFESGETRFLRLRLEAPCIGISCLPGDSCVAGRCADACLVPGEERADPAPCDPDAPTRCPSGSGPAIESFEGSATWPTCPDFEADETSVCTFAGNADLRVVDAAEDPGVLPPCGASQVLRLETNGAGTSAAFIAFPVSTDVAWVTARAYAPEASLRAVEESGRNQALIGWGAGTDVVGPPLRVNFRWAINGQLVQWAQSDPFEQDVSTYDATLPADRWFCLEMKFDREVGEVQPAIDGELLAPSSSELIEGFSGARTVRVGLFSGVIASTLYLDDVRLTNERVGCAE